MKAILDSLGFNATFFLLQIALFIALIFVMKALFWTPMLAHLDGRDQQVKDAYKTIEDTRHEMENLRADYQARLAQIETEARAHIQAAIREAQTERERLLTEARQHAENTLRQGLADMEAEKEATLKAMQEQMVGLAVTAAGKALGPTADSVAIRRSVEERMARSNGNPARN